MQACSSSAGRLGPCGLIVCHIFSFRGSWVRSKVHPREVSCRTFLKRLYIFFWLCTYVCVDMYMWMQIPEEARKGCHSLELELWATQLGCWEMILGPHGCLSSSCGSFKIGFGFVCAYLWIWAHHSVRVVVRGQLLGFLVWPTWVLGVDLRSWDSGAGNFTYGAIWPALSCKSWID